ncbi:hypothetical protein C0995_014362, partial [Termitomyces sp. Mi166
LELNEYMKRKSVWGTATSTATPAESVDYDAIQHQQVPSIAEVMDMLNAPQQANESQQDFKSGVLLQALSEVETATSKVADKEEVEELQQPRMLQRYVMIKEEVHEHLVPEETATLQLAARHVTLVDN